MKFIGVKDNTYIDSIKKLNAKDPKFKKLVIMSEYQSTKTFFLKYIFEIGMKKFL